MNDTDRALGDSQSPMGEPCVFCWPKLVAAVMYHARTGLPCCVGCRKANRDPAVPRFALPYYEPQKKPVAVQTFTLASGGFTGKVSRYRL